MTPDDPWRKLPKGVADGTVAALRVDASCPWNFFWARDPGGLPMLLLKHASPRISEANLPDLRSIRLMDVEEANGGRALSLCLTDVTLRDLFHALCLDLVDRSRTAASEANAVEIAVARTWRWHHLLRGGRNQLLSEQAQLGLIGELVVLEKIFIDRLSPSAAIEAWKGPSGGVHDFRHGAVAVESKCRAEPHTALMISSEFQLDRADLSRLFISATTCYRAPDGEPSTITVTQLAARIEALLKAVDLSAALAFVNRLFAAGFEFDHDYSGFAWEIRRVDFYSIDDAFPALTPSSLPAGVDSVSYAIATPALAEWQVNGSAVSDALGGTDVGK